MYILQEYYCFWKQDWYKVMTSTWPLAVLDWLYHRITTHSGTIFYEWLFCLSINLFFCLSPWSLHSICYIMKTLSWAQYKKHLSYSCLHLDLYVYYHDGNTQNPLFAKKKHKLAPVMVSYNTICVDIFGKWTFWSLIFEIHAMLYLILQNGTIVE